MHRVSIPFGAGAGLLVGTLIGSSIAIVATLVMWVGWPWIVATYAFAGAGWGAWSAHREQS